MKRRSFFRKNFLSALLGLGAVALLFSSCFGVRAEGKVTAKGSGSIALEYRISQEAADFGAQEGSKMYMPIPVSKADFEKGIAGYPGLALESWSQSRAGNDIVVKAKISFTDMAGLVRIFDPRGNFASYSESGGTKIFRLVFGSPGSDSIDKGSMDLIQQSFEGYDMKLALSFPSAPTESTATGIDAKGSIDGKTARFESPMKTLALAASPASWTVRW